MMIVEASLSILWTVPLKRSSLVAAFFRSSARAMAAMDRRRRNTPASSDTTFFMCITFRSFLDILLEPYAETRSADYGLDDPVLLRASATLIIAPVDPARAVFRR